jgi:hypothetical protein
MIMQNKYESDKKFNRWAIMDKATKKFAKVNYKQVNRKLVETGYELVSNSDDYRDTPSYFNYKDAEDVMLRNNIDGVVLNYKEFN